MSASGSSELIRSQNILPDPIRSASLPFIFLKQERKIRFRAPPNLYSFPSLTTFRIRQTPHTPEDVG